jgi:hypothetical protein
MADKQVQTECSVATVFSIANSNKPSDCGNCAHLELQLLQVLNELSSAQLIVDLPNKEHKYKQDKQRLDIVRNDHWTQVALNHKKKPKIIGENSTPYIQTTKKTL